MFAVAVVLLISVAVNVALVLRFVYTCDTRPRRFLVNASLTVFAILLCLSALELGFRRVVVSDAFVITLAGRKWVDTYYKPINSLGYRDDEHEADVRAGRRFMLVVGDSFAAGHGINNYRDRFSNLVGDALGDGWRVGTAAQGGWGTGRELDALRNYPLKPDVLIVSYFVNDIDDAARKAGKMPNIYPAGPSGLARPLVNRSYLLNFLYWRVARGWGDMGQRYWEFTEIAYNDPEIWKIHEGELTSIIAYTEEHDIKLLFVLFPSMTQMEESFAFTEKVKDLLVRKGGPVVDMGDRLAGRPWKSLVVNAIDTHPNESVQRDVAAALVEALTNGGLLEEASDRPHGPGHE